MRRTRRTVTEVFDNPILVGTITILVVVVAVYLSYIAENGLPFVPTYSVNVDVANASELVKNADVRIGGARVGQVLTITPEPATKEWPHPFARLGLSLQHSLEPLPLDTTFQVRLASVLGGKYLEVFPGTAHHGMPDGGTFTLNTNPKLNHDRPFVDLDTAFATFGPRTQEGVRRVISQLGDAVAGRGGQFNDAIHSTRQLIGPLESLLRLFASPSTNLSGFISGLAATTSALSPVSSTLFGPLMTDAATTFDALSNSQLGNAIDQTPATEALATTVLTNALPVLTDAASIVQSLKPGAALLPLASQRLDAILLNATPVFKQVPKVSINLRTTLGAVDTLARDPASTQTFNVLGSSDLATFGSSAFIGLGAILRTVASEQFACNVTGLWVRNFASSLSEGDSTGGWLRFAPIIDPNQLFQAATPDAQLHLNYYPKADLTNGCQAGNEPFTGGQKIGDPGPTSTIVDNTTPPPGVLARGRKAGLVP
jgi:virulence factor Mce-like protein